MLVKHLSRHVNVLLTTKHLNIRTVHTSPIQAPSSLLPTMTINRTTLFKLPNEADIEATLAAYAKLAQTNSKDGKPYILTSKAYKLHSDPRSQGYTLAAQTTFSSVEDMKYYDEECAAHKELKDVVKPRAAGPPLMVYGEA